MKNESTTVSTMNPIIFWVITSLIFIWNLLGVFHYLNSINATVESLVAPGMTIEQAEFFLNVPNYFFTVFALGIWSGILGATLLLFRKTWAAPAFLFSAAMIIVSSVLDGVHGTFSVLGTSYMVIMTITLVIALFSAWYSKRMIAHGILK
jgi:hypothetical protein